MTKQTIKKDTVKSIAIIAIILIFITGIFFIYFYSDSLRFHMDYSKIHNDNNLKSAEQLHGDIPITAVQITSARELMNYIFGNTPDTNETKRNISERLNNICAQKNISNLFIMNPFSEELHFYRQGDGLQKMSFSEFYNINPAFKDALELNKQGVSCIPTSLLVPGNIQTSDFISFFYKDYRDLIIVINLTKDYYKSYMNNQYTDYPIPYSVILQNKANQLIFSKGDTFDISEYENMDDIKIDFPYIINNTKSNNYNITSIINTKDIFLYTLKTGSFIIFIVTLLAIIAVLAIHLFVYKKKKLDLKHMLAISSLENTKNAISLDLMIHKLFNNEFLTQSEKSVIDSRFPTDERHIIRATLITIDDYEKLHDLKSLNDIKLLIYGIQNIICEIFENHNISAHSVSLNNSTIGMLIYGNLADKNLIKKCVSEYSDAVTTHLQTCISTIISTPYTSHLELNIMSLFDAYNYKYTQSRGCLIFTDDIEPVTETIEFPKHIEKKILSAIRGNDKSLYLQYIDEFFAAIKNLDSKTIRKYSIYLFINIDEALNDALTTSPSYDILTDIVHSDYMLDIINIFKTAFTFSANAVTSDESFRQLVNGVIEKEYSNAQLTSGDIAEYFGITPAYFGKKFKKIYNTSFSTFLMEYRLEQARQLLETNAHFTNYQLAEKCGFNSETYFISSFKKHFGRTPKDYKKSE